MIDPQKPIWQLVEHCAKKLTQSGKTPFTRGELVECVQTIRPGCGKGSIDPIIQGITENLCGGASGAVGKNILYSVGRGRFVLSQRRRDKREQKKATSQADRSPGGRRSSSFGADAESITIDGQPFHFVAAIKPVENETGGIAGFFPQDEYQNSKSLPLNKYGEGPFCKFKIPSGLNDCGVYALLVNEELKYIGECVDLSNRYNTGYGNISPRNCYRGGQETNCRINNLIFLAVKSGGRVTLWFHRTEDYKALELELREKLGPAWNRA